MRHFYQFDLFLMLSVTLISCSGSNKQTTSSSSAKSVSKINQGLSKKLGVTVPANAKIKLAEAVLDWQGTPI